MIEGLNVLFLFIKPFLDLNFFPPNSIFFFKNLSKKSMGTVFEIGWNISHAETNVFFKIFCKCIKITQTNLHSYFQKHDTDGTTCAPGGSDGNYIMYAHATSGNLPNNNKFSSCSINQMAPIIENKCRTTTGCFIGKRTCLKPT